MKAKELKEIKEAFNIVLERCRDKGHYTGHDMVIYAYPKEKVENEDNRNGYILIRDASGFNRVGNHKEIGQFMKVYNLMTAIGYADGIRVFSRVGHSLGFVAGNWSFNVFVKVR